ncbi:uncharacterized protein YktA (UPF0223 family) [Oikeobacillus pervagus]|uniref:UPF0223 protein J2S13_001194 n=1 Tax=Oikeobacillus pervagus TaxID=1325931 RepID=A0AAJ1SZZ7_9BACI|nr:UPF0223 family protein [Oikeobacillus pervagus]MDQ0214797.1 uncharacterized protein YktA (UPF0223 family) [Oikeobacillus pervagus]
MEYQYPFSMDWSTNEVIDVVKFFEAVEKAYEKGIQRDNFKKYYHRFKEIVPSIAEEKKIFKEFEKESGYSSYHVVKKMKESRNDQWIAMKS